MTTALSAEKEARRLQTLRDYDILDTAPERHYDDIVRIAAFICQTPMALVALVDEKRQWFKATLGIDAAETPRELSFCTHTIQTPGEIMVVPDAREDARFADNPSVTGEAHIRFYAGAPLVTPGGDALGTLCVVDRQPRELTGPQLQALRDLSRQVVAQLELRRQVRTLERAITEREHYMLQLEQYQKELEETQTRLDVQTTTDPLTGINNRQAFQTKLDEEFTRALRGIGALSLLMLDVDRFKAYNDTFGHPAGDDVLRDVAKILRKAVRGYDVVCRYGGEEFAVILPATGRDAARVIAERCRKSIELAPWRHPVTASIGGATLSSGMSSDALVVHADRALYESKHHGRNRVSFAEGEYR